MNKTFIIAALMTVFSVMGNFQAHAQRTVAGKGFISASGQYAIAKERGTGAMLEGGQYLLSSRWQAGVNYMAKKGEEYNFDQIVAVGEWLYRVIGTRDRAVNFYAGPGIFLGYEYMNRKSPVNVIVDTESGSITTNIDEAEDSNEKFIYGLQAHFDLEIFVSKHVAFTLGLRTPFTFNSNFSTAGVVAAAGLRFNL